MTGSENLVDTRGGVAPDYTFTTGYRARSEFYGSHNHASGYFSNKGDAQYTRVVMRRAVTGVDSTVISVRGDTANLYVNLNEVWVFDVQMVAVCVTSGGTVVADEVASYGFRFTIKKMTSGAPIVMNVQTIGTNYEEGGMAGGSFFVRPYNTTWAEFEVGYVPPAGAAANTVIRVVATLQGTKVTGT
jgi:hypothetical protein